MKFKIYVQLTYLRDTFPFLSRPIDWVRYELLWDDKWFTKYD